MRPRVFVSAPLPGTAVDQVGGVADVVVGSPGVGVEGEELASVAADVEGLLALLTDKIDAALLARLPRLRIVANMAVGFDNVDLDACRARGVVVTNTPGVLTEATADFAFGLLLAAARRVVEGDRMVRDGRFEGWRPTTLLGAKVHGAILGLVGLGRIGQAMARRARGFGMRVVYTQPRRAHADVERALGARWLPLDDLFAAAEIVSLHCPLTPATRGMVDAARLARMRPGAVLVNTARGPIVDEAALVAALTKGPLAAAALDVFAGEGARSVTIAPELLALPNVVFAPHAASAETDTREEMAETAARNLVVFFSGGAPPNALA